MYEVLISALICQVLNSHLLTTPILTTRKRTKRKSIRVLSLRQIIFSKSGETRKYRESQPRSIYLEQKIVEWRTDRNELLKAECGLSWNFRGPNLKEILPLSWILPWGSSPYFHGDDPRKNSHILLRWKGKRTLFDIPQDILHNKGLIFNFTRTLFDLGVWD